MSLLAFRNTMSAKDRRGTRNTYWSNEDIYNISRQVPTPENNVSKRSALWERVTYMVIQSMMPLELSPLTNPPFVHAVLVCVYSPRRLRG